MSDFKKCPKGHTYDSEKEKECPYCNGKKIEDDLEDLPDTPVDKDILKHISDCYLVGRD